MNEKEAKTRADRIMAWLESATQKPAKLEPHNIRPVLTAAYTDEMATYASDGYRAHIYYTPLTEPNEWIVWSHSMQPTEAWRFPDLWALLPDPNWALWRARVNRAQLVEALRYVSVVEKTEEGDDTIYLRPKFDRVELLARNTFVGLEQGAAITAELTGTPPPAALQISRRYLEDALTAFDKTLVTLSGRTREDSLLVGSHGDTLAWLMTKQPYREWRGTGDNDPIMPEVDLPPLDWSPPQAKRRDWTPRNKPVKRPASRGDKPFIMGVGVVSERVKGKWVDYPAMSFLIAAEEADVLVQS